MADASYSQKRTQLRCTSECAGAPQCVLTATTVRSTSLLGAALQPSTRSRVLPHIPSLLTRSAMASSRTNFRAGDRVLGVQWFDEIAGAVGTVVSSADEVG